MLQWFCLSLSISFLISQERFRNTYRSYYTWWVRIISSTSNCRSLNDCSLRFLISVYIFDLSFYLRFSINHSYGSLSTREKSKPLNPIIFCYTALLMSQEDHSEPAISGSTITGIFLQGLLWKLENLIILSQVCNALSCGETKIMSILFRSKLWLVK